MTFRTIKELNARVGIEPRAVIQSAPESSEKERFLYLLDNYSDALIRTCRPGHLTGSSLVFDPFSGQILMLFHSKLQKWLQPGGHADGDGDLARVALREAIEETGIPDLRVLDEVVDLDIHEVSPPKEDRHEHYDVRFLVVAPEGTIPKGNHESQELRWIDVEDLDLLKVDSSVHRLTKRALDRFEEI